MEFKKKQLEFLELAKEGNNLHLSGKAGTGKSTVVMEYIKWAEENNKKIVKLAPTGIAAMNIGGQTIHSFFKLPFGEEYTLKNMPIPKDESIELFNLIDIIVIDEVSMLRPDVLQACFWTMHKGRVNDYLGKQYIFVGDLAQLEAVIKDEEKPAMKKRYGGTKFYDALDYPTLEVETIELDEIVRQSDPEFIEALNIIREDGASPYFRQFVTDTPKGIILAPYNKIVDEYNLKGLNKHEGKIVEYYNEASGKAKLMDFDLPEKVMVKEGCKIMCLINKPDEGVVNGTLGTYTLTKQAITEWKRVPISMIGPGTIQYETVPETTYVDCPGIKLESGKVVPLPQVTNEKKEYEKNEDGELVQKVVGRVKGYPFKLAYALSIHKSQGLTFDEITVDLRKPCFASGQLYTALTRVKTPAGLNLIMKK